MHVCVLLCSTQVYLYTYYIYIRANSMRRCLHVYMFVTICIPDLSSPPPSQIANIHSSVRNCPTIHRTHNKKQMYTPHPLSKMMAAEKTKGSLHQTAQTPSIVAPLPPPQHASAPSPNRPAAIAGQADNRGEQVHVRRAQGVPKGRSAMRERK